MNTTYINWNNLKYNLIESSATPPKFNDREIWWCSIGINVGYELNGKNSSSERPVLILKKYNKDMFFGLPLSTKQKEYITRFDTQTTGKDADIVLDQGKTFSAKRLNRRISRMPSDEFNLVKTKFAQYHGLDTITAP